MADVFISYQRSDRAKAHRLAELLEGYGFSVWWDADLLPGQTYGQAIAEIIRTSRATVVIWSATSVTSNWVLDEASRARDANRLIPVSLGPVQLPMGFGALHTHNIGNWDGTATSAAIDAVIRAIEAHVGRERTEFNGAALVSSGQNSGESEALVDQRQSAAFSRWVGDFLWPFVYVVGLFLLISSAAFLLPKNTDYAKLQQELVKLFHIYAGMIILGGGIFLALLFRIAVSAATRPERWACAEAAKKLIWFVWVPAVVLQPIIGLGMVYTTHSFTIQFTDAYFPRWLQLSLVLYAAAVLSWATGFRTAWEAARADVDYQGAHALSSLYFKRDVLLGVAVACTIGVYGLMVYRVQFQSFFSL